MKKFLCYIPLVLAFWAAVFSFWSLSIPGWSEMEAHYISLRLERRMVQLNKLEHKLMYEPSDCMDWPEIPDLPKDVVIYKYVCDSLHSWYNTLSVNVDDMCGTHYDSRLNNKKFNMSFSLNSVGPDPVFVNLGEKWYVMRRTTSGKVSLLEAIDVTKCKSGIQLVPLCEEEGTVVSMESRPLFKIQEKGDMFSSRPYFISVYCRWLFFIFLAIFILCFLATHRSKKNCIVAIVSFFVIAFAARILTKYLVDFSPDFSPSFFSSEGLLNSFMTLRCFNLAMSLSAVSIYLCRKELKIPVVMVFALAAAYVFYIIITYIILVKNSMIELELYKVKSLDVYSLCAYVSYSFLLVSVLLLIETALFLKKGSSMMAIQWIALYSILSCTILGFLTSYLGVNKEVNKIVTWSKTPYLERNTELETDLRQCMAEFSENSQIEVLNDDDEGLFILNRRFEEMLSGNNNVTLEVNVLEDMAKMEEIINDALDEGVVISTQPSIIFSYYEDKPQYLAYARYANKKKGDKCLVINVKLNALTYESLGLSPEYSFARYKGYRLMSSIGSFSYSTGLRNIDIGELSGQSSIVIDGYRHFVMREDDKNIVVVSRPVKTFATYLLYYIYFVFFVFLILTPFIKRKHKEGVKTSFTLRIRILLMSSLVVTMVIMMALSLLFILRRNKLSQESLMIAKIGFVRDEIENYCYKMRDYEKMTGSGFARAVKGRHLVMPQEEISIYTPQGTYLLMNERYVFKLPENGRVLPKAYKCIVHNYKHYCISEASFDSNFQYVLYAPIYNYKGDILAIVSFPYKRDDYNFTKDVVLHSASLVGLFIFLFLISIIMTYAITSTILNPLQRLNEKMIGVKQKDLELLEYKGDDEISILVDSYNEMVMTLREISIRKIAMERDKAWSEMARQVAHEIKNPLTPIKLEIQRLDLLRKRNDPKWDEKFSAASKIILEHIDILANAANDFSTFAKLYFQAPVKMDLDETIRNQIMLFSGKENLKIEYSGVKDAIISGPKPQLIRVVLNLLTNACQAVDNKENPVVKIMLAEISEKDNHYWKITFEDNGPGVSEENQQNLFVPNFTTKNSGTGLGLAICRNIVEKCGGSILYSRSETLSGACFTVELPDGLSESGSDYSQI